MDNNVLYSALALAHAKNKGGEMLNDVASLLKNGGETLTVDQLLNMPTREFIRTNANETMTTQKVGFGKEFVEEVVLSTELIERMKDSDSLLSDFVIKTMNGRKIDLPVRGARVRMISTTELADQPTGTAPAGQAKKAGTVKISLEAHTVVVTIYYSDELLEDSVIAMAQYVLDEIYLAYENTLHDLIINGDTETGDSVNVNIIDGNTSVLPDGNKNSILLADGLRKTAIDREATVDAGTNFALENIRSARALMGLKGMNPADLLLVMDADTYFETLNLSEVETIEKFGGSATVVNGRISAIDGIAIKTREELGRATATGEISATPASNVLGQVLLVHKPSVIVGIRRDLTTELSRFAEEQMTGVTGSARIGLTIDNTQNSLKATESVVLIRNI